MRKGQATTGFAVAMIGLVLLSMPVLFNNSVDNFGLAATQGIGLTTSFPPWENRTSEETNILYGEDYIAITDGDKSANYRTVELTNEPDEFRLLRIDYNTSIYETDSSITLNISAYDGTGIDYQTQSIELVNGTGVVDLQERLVGEYLRLSVDMSRVTQTDESPRLEDMNVSVQTIDNSPESQMWQKILKLLIIGFGVVTTILLLES